MMRPRPLRALLAALLVSCSSDADRAPPAPAPTAAPSASATADAPEGPLHVVLESPAALSFSGLDGGVWIAGAARSHYAQALGGDDLVAAPMPDGLPDGAGRVARVSGRLPGSVWLSFETLGEGGKVDKTPFYRLTKGSFRRIAEDWQPHVAAWSKNRILSASTSSGRLKIKVLDPHSDRPPSDLPGTRLDDEACAKSLKLKQIAALRSGEVFGAATCKPASAPGTRYAAIRWAPDAATDAGAPPADAAAPPADAAAPPASADADAGAPPDDAGAPAADAGPAEAAAEEDPRAPGAVFVLPGPPKALLHRALHARSPSEVYAAAIEGEGEAAASHLFRFDGATWSADTLPPTKEPLRALSASSDGALWMITARALWKRPPGGAWEQVPLPRAEPDAAWDLSDVWSAEPGDVWIAARVAAKSGERHVVLRSKRPKDVVRWP